MRFRWAVLGVALLSVSLPAFARGGSSEARKWKELLPSVRATSDCLAHGIVASPPALEHARAENWREAIKTVHADCIPLGRTLIAEHDRLYGTGTGEKFVAGPYAADLPRALKARIGSEIARPAEEIARPAEEPVTAEEAPVSTTAPETEAGVQPPALPQNPMRDSGALGTEAAHEADPEALLNERPRPDLVSHRDEFRTAAVSAPPSADEAHPDRPRPVVPSVVWPLCAAMLMAGLLAAKRGLRWKPGRVPEPR